ncbi:DUF2835 family protein [Ningiella sp. W23]|uniref:DUF2835 family protein n=1 Tax=Ningiella sp. W23 TaxID=3023715 RepID=UPI003757D614
MPNKTFTFSISMSYIECQDMYADQIKYVIVTADSGERVQLPKENLRRFLLPTGIHGRFAMEVNSKNKLIRLERQ